MPPQTNQCLCTAACSKLLFQTCCYLFGRCQLDSTPSLTGNKNLLLRDYKKTTIIQRHKAMKFSCPIILERVGTKEVGSLIPNEVINFILLRGFQSSCSGKVEKIFTRKNGLGTSIHWCVFFWVMSQDEEGPNFIGTSILHQHLAIQRATWLQRRKVVHVGFATKGLGKSSWDMLNNRLHGEGWHVSY